ncbi:MAG: polyprenol monophosphomannose synthase [Candidatus Omnitrophota bacterium]
MREKEKNSKLIIIPTYNESTVIIDVLDKIRETSPDADILIVDDNSPDGTGGIIDRIAAEDHSIKCLHRPQKMGIGPAYIDGFKWALSGNYKYVLQMDADFSHNPEHVPKLFETAREYDLVIGSRYTPGGKIENWNILRKLVSRFGSFYSKIILGLPINDLTGGFKCFKVSLLKKIKLDEILTRGYAFQIEMTYRAFQKGAKIKEIPITFTDRREGKTKMTWYIFFEAIFAVLKLRFHKKSRNICRF